MSGSMGPFRPDELADGGARIPDAELAGSYAAARELEQALSSESVHPSATFSDRVMTAVAREPVHKPAGFLAPLQRRHGLVGLVASVRAAWGVAVGGGSRPMGSRGLAMAYVLAVLLMGASLTGFAAYGAAGAIGLLTTPDESPTPSLVEPAPTPSPGAISETPEPGESGEPGESLEPSGSPAGSEEPGDTSAPGTAQPRATSTPRGSDDNGGATASPSQDDHGGATQTPGTGEETSGGDSGATQSPKPSDTPEPSQSP